MVLFNFGIFVHNVGEPIHVNSEVVNKIQSSSDYENLGGDEALFQIVVTDDDDPRN